MDSLIHVPLKIDFRSLLVCVYVICTRVCTGVSSVKAREGHKLSLALQLSTCSFEREPLAVPQGRLTANAEAPAALPPLPTVNRGYTHTAMFSFLHRLWRLKIKSSCLPRKYSYPLG